MRGSAAARPRHDGRKAPGFEPSLKYSSICVYTDPSSFLSDLLPPSRTFAAALFTYRAALHLFLE